MLNENYRVPQLPKAEKENLSPFGTASEENDEEPDAETEEESGDYPEADEEFSNDVPVEEAANSSTEDYSTEEADFDEI